MKLHIFQSDKGDCLLLQSSDGKNILCDGGMAESMRKYVRTSLTKLINKEKGKLDVIYISHIDQDHISGVLQLLQDALDWKIYDYHHSNGNNSVRKPISPRPPSIEVLWHNAFKDQVKDNDGKIGDLLAASAPILFGTSIPELLNTAHDTQNIATSIPEAIRVSQLCKSELLNIPINVLPGSSGPTKLIYYRKNPIQFKIGSLNITVIGPSEKELEDLRAGWNNWLSSNPKTIDRIKTEMQKRIEAFANGQLESTPFDLGDWNGIKDYKGVTVPNVASLVLMVEENGKRLLLTGDSQQDKILEGLGAAGFLNDGKYIHLDVLKIQHHGSDHNIDLNFVRIVSADHYVFCGNGSHGNPEPEVLKLIYNSRLGTSSTLSLAPQAKNRPFTFWFSTNSSHLPSQSAKRNNFEKIEKLVNSMIVNSNGLMKANFVNNDFDTLVI